jgi:serine/threonine-protein kinase PknG
VTRCARPGCTGTILDDGYCDTCGAKARPEAATPATPPAPPAPVPAAEPAPPPRPVQPDVAGLAGLPCPETGCEGRIGADGYCDRCGTRFVPRREPKPKPASRPAVSAPTPGSYVTGSARSRGSRRTPRGTARTASQRSRIGAGLIDVPPAPDIDPRAVVLEAPEVPEEKRFCWNCGSPVGRRRGRRPGLLVGFCAKCRVKFDFVPRLAPGERLAGQYEVAGCMAHGGLGWIYLARDRAVADRWVVLKGLLNQGDDAAMAAALAERRFLAELEHPNIVEIYNFVTHEGDGYTVMEYVGGPSLKQMLQQRRAANDGRPDPLPVEQAIAFILAILPAFTYMHGRGLVYCDFKPDNVIQVGDDVKLIDLGGVRHLDDPSGDIYGTVGFQAPEIAELGPSIASDLYTIGRTLAVLTLDFRGYQSTFEHSLPDPADHPGLAKFDSYHRFLHKATAPHPDDRFQSTPELADQLQGVLRQVVASTMNEPQPGTSNVFGGVPTDAGLPSLLVDPGDPAAGFLANLPPDDAHAALVAMEAAVRTGQVTETIELRLRRARAHLELDRPEAALVDIEAVEREDPWEWRAVWLRGVRALHAGDAAAARTAFDRCMSEGPGELAPQLAAAIAAEQAGDYDAAARLYDVVSMVDPAYVGATAGLARCRLHAGDIGRALEAYERVPRTHQAHEAAQVSAARTLIATHRFTEAAARLDRLALDDRDRAQLDVELLEGALNGIRSGKVKSDPNVRINGLHLQDRSLRRGLEAAYRRLAELTPDDLDRYRLVDRANAVRPMSFV